MTPPRFGFFVGFASVALAACGDGNGPRRVNPSAASRDGSPDAGPKGSAHAASSVDRHARADRGRYLYLNQCASCHGRDGTGHGTLAQSMEPQPRDHTRAAWQNSVTDEHIARVIEKGGLAVGLSSRMPPFPHLSRSEIRALVEHIRSLKAG